MDLLLFTIQHDWPVLTPIVLSSIAMAAVFFNRWKFYNDNERDVVQFIQRLQRELQQGQLDRAQFSSQQLGGVVGEVAEEGIQILSTQKEGFARSFDITIQLGVRRLEQYLPVLGTIGTIAPYLGLFGTVVRILLTFGEMSTAGSNAAGSAQIMFGIGSALIATAFGLIVAIIAVTLNNWFRAKVNRFENDFQMLKLVFLNYCEGQEMSTGSLHSVPQAQQQQQPVRQQQPQQASTGYGPSVY